jgi:hypothetical protein
MDYLLKVKANFAGKCAGPRTKQPGLPLPFKAVNCGGFYQNAPPRRKEFSFPGKFNSAVRISFEMGGGTPP